MSYGTVQAEKMTTESGYSLGAGNASSFKNRIINGDMRVSQYLGTGSSTATAFWPVDRFNVSMGAGTFTGQQVADAPAGFTYSLKLTQASYGSASYKLLQQYVEGLNISDLAFGTASAKPLVLSFWVKASVTGTYTVTLQNAASGGSRLSYVSTYTVNSANTWEQKTIAVTGSTSGTWYTDNQRGLGLLFDLGSTPYATSTLNSWQSGNYFNATGSVDLSNNSGATWFVTGVQLEVGTVATSFDQRSIGTEYALCQRYYQTSTQNAAFGISSTTAIYPWKAPVTMRARPSLAIGGAGAYSSTSPYYESYPWNTAGTCTGATVSATHASVSGGDVLVAGTYSASPAANQVLNLFNQYAPDTLPYNANQSYLIISAEL